MTDKLTDAPPPAGMLRLLDEATARAEAAELLVPPKVAAHFDHVYQRVERAESEAAALRAEVAEAGTRDQRERAIDLAYNTGRADGAEALRAEVERLRTERDTCLSGHVASLQHNLAAATALLECLRWEPDLPGYQKAAIVAFLSATPAPSERAAAERRVLEAMAELSDEWLRSNWGTWRKPADAELARPAVKP